MCKVKRLSDQVLDKSRADQFLYCGVCGGEYSASSGDYWNCSPDHELKCCDEPLELAVKKTEIIIQ